MNLRELVKMHQANAFVFADRGNGSATGEEGRSVFYDDTDSEYGEIEMQELEAPHSSLDGFECNYASEWIEKDDGYSYRIYF